VWCLGYSNNKSSMVASEVADILKRYEINSFSGSRYSCEYISWVYPSGLAAACPFGLVRGWTRDLGGLW
jgi:hypothetical protein